MKRRTVILGLAAVGVAGSAPAFAQADPLPSWNDGAAKKAILDFVARVTTSGGADFVPVPERIAVFDNDGTLWAEQPIYFQFAFAIDRVKALAPQHPEWKDTQPFKCGPRGRHAGARGAGEKGLLEIVAATHSGMTTEEFARDRRRLDRDAHVIRVSTGPIPTSSISRCSSCWPICAPTASRPSSSRAAASSSCGRGPSGSTASRPSRSSAPPASTKFELEADGKPRAHEGAEGRVHRRRARQAGRHQPLHRPPSDLSPSATPTATSRCCEWTAAGRGARFMGIVHHTDAAREWAYDRALARSAGSTRRSTRPCGARAGRSST